MRSYTLVLLTLIFLAFASWLTFFDHHRYGTHGDDIACGGRGDTVTSYTATSYYLFSQPSTGDEVKVGTCPYDKFHARTYAVELWIVVILVGFASYKSFESIQTNEAK